MPSPKSSAQIRAGLKHPVLDADGHFLEVAPVFEDWFFDFASELAGTEAAQALARTEGLFYDSRVQARAESLTLEERRSRGVNRPPFWSLPANTRDRATGYLPRLMHERLPEFGLDFAMLYPSRALPMVSIAEDELRQLAIRALNVYNAEVYSDFRDRLMPVAVIPAHTPEEAVAEIEFVAKELGAKAAMVNGIVKRPIESGGTRLDTLAMDSEYDYEPLWQALVRNRVVPSFHANGQGWGSRRSPSSYVYNHIGSFGASGEAVCKSLFLGGVTRRYPELRFALLEGGVGYACNLYADIISHWEKRNAKSIQALDPSSLDLKEMRALFEKYGDKRTAASLDEIQAWLGVGETSPDPLDEFAAIGVETRAEIEELFIPRFYFGCEADDPMVALAFNRSINPGGVALRPMFSSDIGHWDVSRMDGVLQEAFELVDDGHLDGAQFRDFTFDHAVRFYASLDPGFFDGTAIEKDAASVLANPEAKPSKETSR